MIAHLIIGALAMGVFIFLVGFSNRNDLYLRWWHWLITFLGVIYVVLVLEMIIAFLGEGAPKAALVMGMMTGFVAVVWGVLMRRFVFRKKAIGARA